MSSDTESAIEYFYSLALGDQVADTYGTLADDHRNLIRKAFSKASQDLVVLLYGGNVNEGDMTSLFRQHLVSVLSEYEETTPDVLENLADEAEGHYMAMMEVEMKGYDIIPYTHLTFVQRKKINRAYLDATDPSYNERDLFYGMFYQLLYDEFNSKLDVLHRGLKAETINIEAMKRRVIDSFDSEYREQFLKFSEEDQTRFFDEYMQQPHILEQMKIYGTK